MKWEIKKTKIFSTRRKIKNKRIRRQRKTLKGRVENITDSGRFDVGEVCILSRFVFSETSSNYHSEGPQQKQLPDIFVLVWNKQKWTYPNGHGHTQWTYLMWEWSKSYNLVRFGEKSVFFLQKCGMWRFCFSLQWPNISQTTLGFQNFSSQFGKVWLLKLLVTFYPKIFWALIFWKTIFIQNYLGLNYS